MHGGDKRFVAHQTNDVRAGTDRRLIERAARREWLDPSIVQRFDDVVGGRPIDGLSLGGGGRQFADTGDFVEPAAVAGVLQPALGLVE
jgi:hypothetical protein